MGEANRRGPREVRIAQSIERKAREEEARLEAQRQRQLEHERWLASLTPEERLQALTASRRRRSSGLLLPILAALATPSTRRS